MPETSCIGYVIFQWFPQAESSVLVLHSDFAYKSKHLFLPKFESRTSHVYMRSDVFKLIIYIYFLEQVSCH